MENVQIDISTLQASRNINFEAISPKYFIVVCIRTGIFLLFVLTAIVAFFLFDKLSMMQLLSISGTVFSILIIYLLITKQTFKYRGIAVREHDVIFRSSFINVVETLVPYKRVQHVKLKRGLIEKAFGLSELIVFTAAGGAQNLSIAGLEMENAEQIKSYIIDRFDGQSISENASAIDNQATHEG